MSTLVEIIFTITTHVATHRYGLCEYVLTCLRERPQVEQCIFITGGKYYYHQNNSFSFQFHLRLLFASVSGSGKTGKIYGTAHNKCNIFFNSIVESFQLAFDYFLNGRELTTVKHKFSLVPKLLQGELLLLLCSNSPTSCTGLQPSAMPPPIAIPTPLDCFIFLK